MPRSAWRSRRSGPPVPCSSRPRAPGAWPRRCSRRPWLSSSMPRPWRSLIVVLVGAAVSLGRLQSRRAAARALLHGAGRATVAHAVPHPRERALVHRRPGGCGQHPRGRPGLSRLASSATGGRGASCFSVPRISWARTVGWRSVPLHRPRRRALTVSIIEHMPTIDDGARTPRPRCRRCRAASGCSNCWPTPASR